MLGDETDCDLLMGAERIAGFLNRLFDGAEISRRDVYNWVDRGVLPHAKHGARIVASKSRLRQHFYPPTPANNSAARR